METSLSVSSSRCPALLGVQSAASPPAVPSLSGCRGAGVPCRLSAKPAGCTYPAASGGSWSRLVTAKQPAPSEEGVSALDEQGKIYARFKVFSLMNI